MNIAVTGTGGMIGSRFVDMYKEEFNITCLRSGKDAGRHTYQLNDYKSIEKNLENIDTLIHCALDNTFKYNLIGLKNFIEAGKSQGLKRLIFLSSFAVYDPYYVGTLSEASPYSKLKDPYTRDKQALENIINSSKSDFKIVILQPTIVYGPKGGWTKHAIDMRLYNSVSLPEKGNMPCNCVYVDDVVKAIYQSTCVELHSKITKLLISADTNITWADFYKSHCIPKDIKIIPQSNLEFHDNKINNFIFILRFATPLSQLIRLIFDFFKRGRTIVQTNVRNLRSENDTKSALINPEIKEKFSATGMLRLAQRSNFIVDFSQARRIIDYNPVFTFQLGISRIFKIMKADK